jgi:thiol-disulfide isomerase/thioredoxin
MKLKKVCLMSSLLLFMTSSVFAQQYVFPKVELEDLNLEIIPSDEILNEDGPTVLSFWATWCKPCIVELNELSDL